jgi:Transglutaminase-like superfamily
MNKWIVLLLLIAYAPVYAQQGIPLSTIEKFSKTDCSTIRNSKELSGVISAVTKDPKEQLQMLLLWADKFLQVDTSRFFSGGYPLTTAESIQKRTGLCDEYANIVAEFCKLNNITCIRIEGYVKYAGFKSTDVLDDANHAWNAVYIDSSWLLCDLFWSTCELINKRDGFRFIKKINTAYYLIPPAQLISTHLPLDPVFQFSNYPISMQSFYTAAQRADSSTGTGYINYHDSLIAYLKLNEQEQKIKVAENSYLFNKDNPNVRIAAYYNYAVVIVNDKKATLPELKRAGHFLDTAMDLIKHSLKPDIQELLPACRQGKLRIEKRISGL